MFKEIPLLVFDLSNLIHELPPPYPTNFDHKFKQILLFPSLEFLMSNYHMFHCRFERPVFHLQRKYLSNMFPHNLLEYIRHLTHIQLVHLYQIVLFLVSKWLT